MADAQPNHDLTPVAPEIAAEAAKALMDVSVLKEMLGAEETEEILNIFVASTEELLVRINQATDNKNAQALRETAHELKGACASVGAAGMARLCFDLEQVARNNDWSSALRLKNSLTPMFESTKIFIAELKT